MHLLCKCGIDMWNGEIPNDIEYTVFSDKRMNDIFEEDTVDTIDLAQMNDYNVWRCPKCGRLYIFRNADNKLLFVYKLEEQTENE